MIKLYALINSETGDITNISIPGSGKPRYISLNPKYFEVELNTNAKGKTNLVGDKDKLIKLHNWNRVKAERVANSRQDITVEGFDFSLDQESFEAMKDLVSVLSDGESTSWKVNQRDAQNLPKGKTVQSITKEQLKEVVETFIKRRQDGYEISWEVETELSSGKTYAEASIMLKDKFKKRKKSRVDKKKKAKGNS